MVFCSKCGKSISEEDYVYCPHCGSQSNISQIQSKEETGDSIPQKPKKNNVKKSQ
jgi:uncharacterized membrane protein YvbJ